MKILDRYILTTYLKTFFSVFIILMLIFVLQTIWLYISELAGKDLDILVVGKFLLYFSPKLVPLVLPLTILLASIMVFGNFAENYEFAAMKSTGISLQRAMRSLSVFIVLLGITAFFFSNNVIPWAEYNSYNLRKNIAKVKPAMAIAEGQFNPIGNINIKVAKKTGDRGQYLEDVIIHQKKSTRKGNYTVIKSKTGELISDEKSDVLKLVLFDGNYYEDILSKDPKDRNKKPHAKSTFETYTINIDLSSFNDIDLEEKNFDSRYTMLNINELTYTVDSLKNKKQEDIKAFSENLHNRSAALTLNSGFEVKEDTIFSGDDILDVFTVKKKVQLLDLALNSVKSTQQIITAKEKTFSRVDKNLNRHIVAYYDKFVLGFACIILFFVGAPLGALIRKGGIGLPMVIAILLFLTYHFIGIFAKNSSDDNSLNPIIATWLSTGIMLPLSIYLTNRATKDRGLFDLDSITDPLKRLFRIQENDVEEQITYFDINSEDYQELLQSSDDKLIDYANNYRQYGFDAKYKNTSLRILKLRGITERDLKMSGKLTNQNYEEAKRHYNMNASNSKMAFILYCIYVVLFGLSLVFANNKLPVLDIVFKVISTVALILFIIFIIKSFFNQSNFYKQLDKPNVIGVIMFLFIGIPFYAFYHFYQKKKMKEELKHVS